ncbi:MAG: hypothetical protein JWQ90_4888 [Hydrocarboniphaga sp.]|nr:DUF1329 domain-containing protein [Hydrocarboniphaga sp.]MDB5972438.1 hypothetical protein [Hydrocarboniphaga sp.]
MNFVRTVGRVATRRCESMKKRRVATRPTLLVCLVAAAAVFPALAMARVSTQEAAHLGKDLTPLGATAAGNAQGSIPAFLGAKAFDEAIKTQTPQTLEAMRAALDDLRKSKPQDFDALTQDFDTLTPQNYPQMRQHLDAMLAKMPAAPQAVARSLYQQLTPGVPQLVITHDNYAQYTEQLTAGHQALFAKYADYKMLVYPSLRNGFYPKAIDDATTRNALTAELVGTDEVKGAVLGFPFPIPKSGAEVIWNHKVRFRSSAVRRYNNQAIVKPDGSYQLSKLIEDVKFKYGNLEENNAGTPIIFYYLSKVLSPPRLAGQMLLVHESMGIDGRTRDAWLYNPGLGRVNRAPEVGYDNPALGSDGEQFNDQIDVFNGALDRYDWKLLGKRELYIPYNSLQMLSPMVRYKDLIRPGHLNQNLARYELHRVWVVEATLRAGLRHQFKKRRFYLDEDGWAIAVVDCYDNQDRMWKVQEAHLASLPFVPLVTGVPEAIYDLQSGRYFLTTLVNEDRYQDFKIHYKDDDFSPAAMNQKARH